MTTIVKSTVVENIYKEIYDLVSAITNFSTIVYPAFPDVFNIDDKSDYPIVIINSPEISNNLFTFGKGLVDGTISIDVYTTSAKTTDEYSSDVIDKIETSKATLSGDGLRQVNLSSTNKDTVMRGNMKVHLKTLIFGFKFVYSSTRGF